MMRMPAWLNIALSQVGWFACVLSAADGRPAIGLAVAAMTVAVHMLLVNERGRELRILAAAGLIGAIADSVLVQLDVLRFDGGDALAGLTTPWMIALWVLLATTLRHAFEWLHRRLVLAACLGAVGGPAAYFAGARLGALDIADSMTAYLAISLEWALALPALLLIARSGSEREQPTQLQRGERWT